MTDANTLPWDTDGRTAHSDGGDPHARATALATAAMNAAALAGPGAGPSSYELERAEFARRLSDMRASTSRAHLDANNARAAEAAERKAARQAAHEARQAALAEEARVRRALKAA